MESTHFQTLNWKNRTQIKLKPSLSTVSFHISILSRAYQFQKIRRQELSKKLNLRQFCHHYEVHLWSMEWKQHHCDWLEEKDQIKWTSHRIIPQFHQKTLFGQSFLPPGRILIHRVFSDPSYRANRYSVKGSRNRQISQRASHQGKFSLKLRVTKKMTSLFSVAFCSFYLPFTTFRTTPSGTWRLSHLSTRIIFGKSPISGMLRSLSPHTKKC
jgi:hypothetical protein